MFAINSAPHRFFYLINPWKNTTALKALSWSSKIRGPLANTYCYFPTYMKLLITKSGNCISTTCHSPSMSKNLTFNDPSRLTTRLLPFHVDE